MDARATRGTTETRAKAGTVVRDDLGDRLVARTTAILEAVPRMGEDDLTMGRTRGTLRAAAKDDLVTTEVATHATGERTPVELGVMTASHIQRTVAVMSGNPTRVIESHIRKMVAEMTVGHGVTLDVSSGNMMTSRTRASTSLPILTSR